MQGGQRFAIFPHPMVDSTERGTPVKIVIPHIQTQSTQTFIVIQTQIVHSSIQAEGTSPLLRNHCSSSNTVWSISSIKCRTTILMISSAIRPRVSSESIPAIEDNATSGDVMASSFDHLGRYMNFGGSHSVP